MNSQDQIKQLSHELKYENKWMKVYEDKIQRGNGACGIYGVVEKPAFALIVPFDGKGFYVVEQYRYPLKVRSIEFPMGSLELEDSTELECARRELREECGLVADSIREIGSFYVAVGFSNQVGHVFFASGLTKTKNDLDEEEADLVCKYVPLEEFKKMIEANVIKDSATIAAWAMVRNMV